MRRVFLAALAALGPCAATQACGTSTPVGAAPDAARADDATRAAPDVTEDPADGAPSPVDAPPETGRDARVSCGSYVTVVDGGPSDADADVDNLFCNYRFACGIPAGVTNLGCEIVGVDLDGAPLPDANPMKCRVLEGYGCEQDAYAPPADGAITVQCKDCLGGGGGRHTAGVRRPRAGAASLGGYFARAAHAEAASVYAFRRMGRELAATGAPRALVVAARRAARDEIAHARAMRTFARAAGERVGGVRVARAERPRSLEAFARENAVEGCVRETFLALVALHQATHATSGRVRRAFARIAADETKHAALAWAVARWAESALDPPARRRVARARDAAGSKLRDALARAEPQPFDRAIGNPSPEVARALFRALEQAWGTAS